MQADLESRAKEAKREVSRIQMEAEARKQQLKQEAEAQKLAVEAAEREEKARTAQERLQRLQDQWRESEVLKQVSKLCTCHQHLLRACAGIYIPLRDQACTSRSLQP